MPGIVEKKVQAEIDGLHQQINRIPAGGTTPVFSVVSHTPGAMRVFLRGDVTRPGDEVAPSGIKAIANVSASFGIDKSAADAQRRQRLADWISHRDNGPLDEKGPGSRR